MEWFYSKNTTQLGPVSLAELQALIRSGQVLPSDMAWTEGMADWKPVSSLPQLGGAAPAPVLSGGFPANLSGVTLNPNQLNAQPATNGLATASLVCGILGFLCGIPVSIAAVICGHIALIQINNSRVPVQGRGMAIAGLVMGYLILAITIVAIIFVLFFSKDSTMSPIPA